MAEEVFRQVDSVMASLRLSPVKHLEMYSVHQKFYADVPTIERALAIAAEAKEKAGIDGAAWIAEVTSLIGKGVHCQTDNIELQYFALNDGCICGLPNEIMCELALQASTRMNTDLFYLSGYTNGCTGYLPTEEEYDKGGYEVFWSMLIYYIYHGRVSPLNRDSALKLVQTAIENAPIYLGTHGK